MEINQNNLLVIGGTGFIGRYVVKEALKRNFSITVLSFKEVLEEQRISKVKYIQADATDFQELKTKI